jgi:hypothetical protein
MPDEPAEPQNPPTGPDTPPEPAEAPHGGARRLERDVNGLLARADQVDAEIHALDITVVLIAFALGALAGLVFLQSKELRALTG